MIQLNHTSCNRLGWQALAAALVFTAGSGFARDEIKVYRVAKQPTQAAEPHDHDHAHDAAPSWKTPVGWKELAPSQMRLASFLVEKDGKKADVSVVPLPGGAGGDAANVNRWRGQVGLASLSSEELRKTAELVKIGELNGELYDVSGTNSSNEPSRILGAIQHREGTAWFFKMTGDTALVGEQKPAFLEFLKTFEFGGHGDLPPGHPPTETSGLPPGHPDISSTTSKAAPARAAAREGQPKWDAPKNWKEVSGGQFLFAKFMISGTDGEAAVNVSVSGGDGGGLAGNVNRWRGQLGLSPFGEEELSKSVKSLNTDGGAASLVEMSGTDARTGKAAKLIGAIVPQGGQTWFYKLMGDAKVVESERDAFTKFVQTVKY